MHYVGQAIELQVVTVAEADRPQVGTPRVGGAEVSLVGTDLKLISASGIGDFVTERNLFLWQFRIIPRRAGILEIPPVVVRLGRRSGASPSLRLTIQASPLSGRPAEFLGGVGAFEVEAEARPAIVQSGQALEYRVRVTGPAARGMTAAPDLTRFNHVPLGLQVEPIPSEVIADPPSRVFRSRVRPTRAGEAVLPPVAIAALDPKTARYLTKVTSGVPIRVVDVPRFDPATLGYGPPARPPTSRPTQAVVWVVGALTAFVIAAVIVRLVVRPTWRRPKGATARGPDRPTARRRPGGRRGRPAGHRRIGRVPEPRGGSASRCFDTR